MSIARMSYVMCDDCGNPASCQDGATQAREAARSEGFVRRDGKDLCGTCATRTPDQPNAATTQEDA